MLAKITSKRTRRRALPSAATTSVSSVGAAGGSGAGRFVNYGYHRPAGKRGSGAQMTAAPDARAATRTAVIGVGYNGRIHAQQYAQLTDSQLVAVVDADADAASKVGAELGVPA